MDNLEELKKYIEEGLKDLDKTLLDVIKNSHAVDTSTLQAHIDGIKSGYNNVLNKIRELTGTTNPEFDEVREYLKNFNFNDSDISLPIPNYQTSQGDEYQFDVLDTSHIKITKI